MDRHCTEKAYEATSSLSWRKEDDWLVMSASGTELLSGEMRAMYLPFLCWRLMSEGSYESQGDKAGQSHYWSGRQEAFECCHHPVVCHCPPLWVWISIDEKWGRMDQKISKPFPVLTFCSFRARATIFMINGEMYRTDFSWTFWKGIPPRTYTVWGKFN